MISAWEPLLSVIPSHWQDAEGEAKSLFSHLTIKLQWRVERWCGGTPAALTARASRGAASVRHTPSVRLLLQKGVELLLDVGEGVIAQVVDLPRLPALLPLLWRTLLRRWRRRRRRGWRRRRWLFTHLLTEFSLWDRHRCAERTEQLSRNEWLKLRAVLYMEWFHQVQLQLDSHPPPPPPKWNFLTGEFALSTLKCHMQAFLQCQSTKVTFYDTFAADKSRVC